MSIELKEFETSLKQRAGSKCELCASDSNLDVVEIPPIAIPPGSDISKCVLICTTCQSQSEGETALDENHWQCLQTSAWSQLPAVQVVAWRMLKRLKSQSWAQDLLDQIYLDEPTLAWAIEGFEEHEDVEPTLDSNGTALADGDTVSIIKDLDVKGTGFVAKRGTVVKNIRLTSNPEHVEGRVNKTAIVLKTCFLKKSS